MECIVGRYTLVHWTELSLRGIHPVDPKDMSFVSNEVSIAVLLRGGQTDPSDIMYLPKRGNELVDIVHF